jgi:hypothetical protein
MLKKLLRARVPLDEAPLLLLDEAGEPIAVGRPFRRLRHSRQG